MTIPDTIEAALRDAGVAADAPLLLALSGGADSTALLLALCELGRTVHALHCNFELRGSESDRDEAACRRLCREHGVALTVKHFRTQSYARRNGLSIEMAARELRYEWFAAMARQLSIPTLCVAHHLDDNVETMLLNLVRGSGLRGLTGMRLVQRRDDGLVVVRPMLSVWRDAVESWLRGQGVAWQVDSSNLRPDAARRNMIRLELMPILKSVNVRVRENLAATSERLTEATALYDDAVARARASVTSPTARGLRIDTSALLATVAPRSVLYELLRPYGFSGDQAQDIFDHLSGEPGSMWSAAKGRVLRDRGCLLVEAAQSDVVNGSKPQPKAATAVLPLEGVADIGSVSLRIRRQPVDGAFEIPRRASVACFDLRKLTLPLSVRTVVEGDRFRPFGMEGTRLVSDLLTDLKVPLFERERQLVVLSGDTIVWVVGRRAAAGYEIDGDTRHAMTLSVENGSY